MEYVKGYIPYDDYLLEGYVSIDNGIITEINEGPCLFPTIAEGIIMPSLVNSHTHCADGGLNIPSRMSLEKLVSPPGGLKHNYLRDTSDKVIIKSIKKYNGVSLGNGIGKFIDFREGGEKGCKMLRNSVPNSIILGRPISKEYDFNEISRILKTADGIGISSISDMDYDYVENIANHVRKSKKILGLHASERVREDIDSIIALEPDFLVHMIESTDEDLSKCADAEIPIVVCPRSNKYFGKTPPVEKMEVSGVDIILGTDNAMLCDPDLRKEAEAYISLTSTQNIDVNNIWNILVNNPKKIMRGRDKVNVSIGMKADLTIFPCRDSSDPQKVLRNPEPIISLSSPRK